MNSFARGWKPLLAVLPLLFLAGCAAHHEIRPATAALTASASHARSSIAAATATAKHLAPLVSADLRPEVERLTLELDRAGQELDALSAQILNYTRRAEALENENAALHAENKQLKTDLSAATATAKKLTAENAKLAKDSAALQWWHRYVRNPAIGVGGLGVLWLLFKLVIGSARIAARFSPA